MPTKCHLLAGTALAATLALAGTAFSAERTDLTQLPRRRGNDDAYRCRPRVCRRRRSRSFRRLGLRHDRRRSEGEAGRQLLRIRQRHMGRAHHDSFGPLPFRPVRFARPTGPRTSFAPSSRMRPASGVPPDTERGKIGALFKCIHGRGTDRDARRRADRCRSCRHPRRQDQDRLCRPDGRIRSAVSARRCSPLAFREDAKDPTRNTLTVLTGRIGPARSRLLSARRLQGQKGEIPRLHRADAGAWWAGPTRQGVRDDIVALETQHRRGELEPDREPRPRQDLQPDDLGGARGLCAGLPVVVMARRLRCRRAGRKSIVRQNTAFPEARRDFRRVRRSTTLQAWQAFHVVDQSAPYLSKRFVDARFEFRSKELGGQPEERARWRRATQLVNGSLGEARGQGIYRRAISRAESKAKVEALVEPVERRAGAPDRESALDDAGDQGEGARKALAVHGQDRLSREMARLFRAEFGCRRSGRQCPPRQRVPLGLCARQA